MVVDNILLDTWTSLKSNLLVCQNFYLCADYSLHVLLILNPVEIINCFITSSAIDTQYGPTFGLFAYWSHTYRLAQICIAPDAVSPHILLALNQDFHFFTQTE